MMKENADGISIVRLHSTSDKGVHTMTYTKRLEDVLNDFSKWMSNHEDILFDWETDGDDGETYEVTITGLNYIDAQNALELGLECGKSATIKIEEGDEQDGNN